MRAVWEKFPFQDIRLPLEAGSIQVAKHLQTGHSTLIDKVPENVS